MTTASIRKKLIAYIAEADEGKVKGLYKLVADDITDNEKFKLSAAHIAILEKERQMHMQGKTKSYNWSEAKEIIRGKSNM